MSKIKCVMQDGPKDCGICCLLMIIRNYGGDVSKEKLREMTNTTTSGVNAYNLLETACKLGFQGKGMKGDITKLDTFLLPCIAHVIIDEKYKHFVVIEEINIKRNLLVILDPAQGKRKMTFEEFSKISTNQYLYLKPKRPLINFTPHKTIQTLLRTFIEKNKKVFVIIVIFSCFYTVINMVVAFHFKFLIEYVFPYASFSNAKTISILICLLILFQLLIQYMRQNLLRILETNFGYYLMESIIEQIISLPYSYYKNRTTGEIMNRINDVEQLKEFIVNLFASLFIDFLCAVAMLLILFKINITLTLFLLVIVIVVGALLCLCRIFLKNTWREVHTSESKLHTSFIQCLEGVDTSKGLHLETFLVDYLCHQYGNFLKSIGNTKYKLSKWEYLKEHFFKLGLVLMLWKGSILVIDKRLTVTNFIIFYNFYGYFLQSIQNIFNFLFSCSSINIVIHRLEDLFEVKKESFEVMPNRSKKIIVGDIWFDHLYYNYQEEKPLLNDISLHIKPSEKVVLYGNSGSGKSTLVKLLFRLVPLKKGRILLDGLDIRYYTLDDIRNHITYVSQNEVLFAGTIYQNIVLDKDVEYEQFLKVCHITKVDEIIHDNILGYDELIEENGFNLSGGERQRIILARSLLKKSNIYIFDESFNQLDISKEKEILKDVFAFLKDQTVIVISHRYHNQELFDRKIKIKQGVCSEIINMV